jgi:hypothetical protein
MITSEKFFSTGSHSLSEAYRFSYRQCNPVLTLEIARARELLAFLGFKLFHPTPDVHRQFSMSDVLSLERESESESESDFKTNRSGILNRSS